MNAVSDAVSGYPSRRTAWYAVFILMLCYTLSYADRQILAFLVGPLKQDLHISDTQVGFLQGLAFALFYTVAGLPMGMLADRFKRRTVIAVGVFLWSLMTSLSSVARSFWSLAAARMGVGIGEATLSPCAFSLIADSFPKERLSSALSVYTMGIQLGSGLALIVGGAVAQAVSHLPPVELPVFGHVSAWRVTFLIVGAPGLVMALLLFTVREPIRRALLLGVGGAVTPPGLRDAFKHLRARGRSVVGLAVMIACQATCNYALLGWGPEFFGRVHQWPKDTTGLVLGLITLACGCIGLFVGGRLSDYWNRKGVHEGALRVGLISLIGVAVTLTPAMMLPDVRWTVALLVPAVFFIGLPIGCAYAAVQLIFPNQVRGLASAVVIFAVALVGLGVGAQLPGAFNDHLFHNGQMVGYSISLTVLIASVVGMCAVALTFAPYRRDYQAVHRPGISQPPCESGRLQPGG